MVAETTTYQCPNCNGRLVFNSDIGKLKCESCDSEFTAQEVEAIWAERQAIADGRAAAEAASGAAASGAGASGAAVEAGAGAAAAGAAGIAAPEATGAVSRPESVGPAVEQGEDPIDTYLRNAHWDNLGEEQLRSFNCSSCGAQLLVDQVTAVTSCPYCGNNAVVPGQLSDMLKPDYVIPFKLDRDAAIAALTNYYKGKKFLPNDFTADNHIEEIQGVYVPFWLYSGTGQAEARFDATRSRTWSDSENIYTETDHYRIVREGTMSFTRVPVDGSTKMPDAHMDAIEPFDYGEMVPFSVGYLPGYLTDRYDQGVKTCETRANNRVENTCVDTLEGTVSGYETVNLKGSSARLALNDVAYALLPVWMLHTKYNGEDFLFAMNGQTGRLVGDLPIDNGKVVRWSLTIFFPLAILLFIVVWFTMGFGV